MGRNAISIRDRVNEYKSEHFYESDSNILMCKLCNRRLERKKPDILEKHIKSEGHQTAKINFTTGQMNQEMRYKRQATVSSMLENQKRAKIEKSSFIHNTVNVCLESNIPIHKLDHPAVRKCLAKICTRFRRLAWCKYTSKQLCASLWRGDETKTLAPTAEQEVYLASCSFLDTANGTTCSQEIIDSIKEYDVRYNDTLGLVSDSARYMGKCFQALQTIVGDHLLHFQYFAHKLYLVGDIFLKGFSSLNLLVSKLKMVFLLSRKMRNNYLNFIKESYPSLPSILFPAPVITRWNSWFKAVHSSTASVISMFQEKQSAAKLKVEIVFVSEVSEKISELIKPLEGPKYPFGYTLCDELKVVSFTLERYVHGRLLSETERLVNACINVVAKEKIK
ncbi:hypothetical protein PR048_027631 [Dryococelus australis]|uniref:Uncharacterized protein n=1 Tax=Dryococelus australis TaxID=614101 RepID=A0ABQ9GH18_9NEOP|nr:hypothetical protein PR048_027631 [Dryococelus australis]